MVYSLFMAADELKEADSVLVSYADILYSEDVLRTLMDAEGSWNVVVDSEWHSYYSARSDDVLSDAESLIVKDGRIIDIGRRVDSIDDIQGQYIGLMKFDRRAIELVLDLVSGGLEDGREIGWGRPVRTAYMTDLLQEVANHGEEIRPVPISGGWFEVDTLEDHALAEQLLPSLGLGPA